MIRTQIQLTEEQSQILKSLSVEKGTSVAELIRQCVDNYIRSINRPTLDERREKALAVIGIASSKVSDLSINHDQYLADAYGEFGE